MSNALGAPAAEKRAPAMAPPESGVTVRMYRQGLGDCFLLAFPTTNPGEAFYMLIDCGVIIGTQDPDTIMTRVAEDIEAATGGDIHLLVITHQHWDHLSGFVQAEAVWRRMRIHNLWFAWTEDPDDDLAQQLRKQFEKERTALQMAVGRAFDAGSVEHIANLLYFFGEPEAPVAARSGETLAGDGDHVMALAGVDGEGLAAARRAGTDKALELIRDMAKQTNAVPQYRRPGETLPGLPKVEGLGDVPGARIYILGPPRDERALRRNLPTGKGKEVYTEGLTLTPQTAFLMAVQDPAQLFTEEQEFHELSFPFDARLRIPTNPEQQDQQHRAFFEAHYGFDRRSHDNARPPEEGGELDQEWRRIDDDWLGAAGELALQLDSYTNNTSLVMAIELANTRKVLLFVGDAQVGNWLSWDEIHWQVDETTGEAQPITTADLLQRTVLYKVGHHGSHNATIRQEGPDRPAGLELMTHPELVAMIPVNHAMAVRKGWDKMPFKPLVHRLEEKTRHRILSVDDLIPKSKPEGMSDVDWQAFQAHFHETELYMQYTVADPPAETP